MSVKWESLYGVMEADRASLQIKPGSANRLEQHHPCPTQIRAQLGDRVWIRCTAGLPNTWLHEEGSLASVNDWVITDKAN